MIKRILHFQGRMGLGGAESFMMNVYRNADLTKMQFDFVVYDTFKKVDDYNHEIKQKGGRVYVVPNPKKHPIAYLIAVRQLLQQHQFYGVENEVYFGGGINLWLAKRAGIKRRVAVSHATSDGKGKTLSHKVLSMLLKKMLLNNATDLIAVSQEAGVSLFGSKQFSVVPNGIDLTLFRDTKGARQKMRSEFHIASETVVGLNIGRLEPQKNQKYLADIIDNMSQKQKSEFVLYVVGTGTMDSELEQYFRSKKVLSNVVFLGKRKDIPELLAMSDVFLLPSKYEGLPTVGIEAQAAGKKSIFSTAVSPETKLSNQAIFIDTEQRDIQNWINNIFLQNNQYVADEKLFEFDSKRSAKKVLSLYEDEK